MPLAQFVIPTPSDIRDGFLRTLRNGLIARGVANPNVGQGSDWWLEGTALADELAPAFANQVVKADAAMPDTATGADLVRLAGIYGVPQRTPQGASGGIVVASSGVAGVAVGAQLVDTKGKRYGVLVGGAYGNGATIPVRGVDTGPDTNHAAGDLLTWVSPPVGFSQTAKVAGGGLTGGVGVETDDSLRARLLDHLRNPPAGGNWSHVVELAEAASGSVQKAFVYPGLDGPATFGVCVCGPLRYDATAGNYTRALTSDQVATVAGYVAANMPQHAQMTCLGVADVQDDVVVQMSLPAAASAGGPGGGWTDASPWPRPTAASNVHVAAVLVSGTQFEIEETGSAMSGTCVVGQTKIAWFDRANGTIRTSTVIAKTAGGTGEFLITLDPTAPFPGIAVGDYVFPASENVAAYGAAWLDAMSRLGAGQWTDAIARLPRASRMPLTSQEWPSDLTAIQLRALSDAGPEVLDVQYGARLYTSPAVPAGTSYPPKVLVPRQFAIYPI